MMLGSAAGMITWRPNFTAKTQIMTTTGTRRVLFLHLLFSILLAGATCAEDAPNVAPRKDYTELAGKLAAVVQHEMEQKHLPAFSIALVDQDQIVWAQGFGYQDPDRKVPATAHTVYRVGSVSKLFTDIAIMQMVEAGKVNLDSPITDYVPDFHPRNPYNEPITLRELMSHRSGLLREPPVGNYFDPTEPTLQATVRSMNSTGLVYRPGSHVKYSNAGIAVVGYTLQQLNHEAFAEYLKRAVLAPLGMQESSFLPDPELMKNLAKAYMWSYDGLTFPAPTFQLGLAPAGCMYSTVLDLAQFLTALFNGGHGAQGVMLKPETLERMWTPQFAKAGEKTGFGIGFHVTQLDGHRVIGHGGAIYGFATEVAGLPDDKLGVVTVTTEDAANAVTNAVAKQALQWMLVLRGGQPLSDAPHTADIPEDLSRKFMGRYRSGREVIELIEGDDGLEMLPAGGGFESHLRMLGNALVPDGRLDEDFDSKILLTENRIRIGEKHFVREPEPRPALPAKNLTGLIGEYGWDHDILYVFEKDRKLNLLIEWFEYDPLEQVSRDTFKFPKHGLYDGETAIFTRDGKGRATQVKIGEVVFKRHDNPESHANIQVHPTETISELRRRALADTPPGEKQSSRTPDLVDLTTIDPTIRLDIRYATRNNFLGTPVYEEAKAYLQRPAAEALGRAAKQLQQLGYGLLIHDAYRPWYVTKIFWDATPPDKRIFVADPAQGSRHNRGCAVDLTLYDLKSGAELPMTGNYDEMSERSYAAYPGGTSLERWDRAVLRRALEAEGFRVYPYEWWHFDYKEWQQYPILNTTFERLSAAHGELHDGTLEKKRRNITSGRPPLSPHLRGTQ